jgi:hypothetical protein
MQNNELIEQLNLPYRPEAFIRITFDMIDPDTNPIKSVNGETNYSDFANLDEEKEQEKNYATLEKNFWRLDDSQPLLESEELYQKYTSSYMSNAECIYEEKPQIQLVSDEYVTTVGITISFDRITEDYPSLLNIKAYKDDKEIMDKDYEIHDFKENLIFADNEELVNWNKIVITILKSKYPYRRCRIQQLIVGIREVYKKENIANAEVNEKRTFINSVLPIHNFKFCLVNKDQKFNPDNPQGWYRYILEKQPIKYEWGYTMPDGNIEWVLAGQMLLSGSVEADDKTATFSATNIISYLSDIYKKGVYRQDGASMYDLAIEIFNDSELGPANYVIDEKLKSIYTNAPLPKLPKNQLLQLIATASKCELYVDENNVIYITPVKHEIIDTIEKKSYMTKPRVALQPPLKNVIVNINNYVVSNEVSEIYKVENLQIGDKKTIAIEYPLATDIVAEVTNGTITEAHYCAQYAVLTITSENSVNLIIKGRKIEKTLIQQVSNYHETGEDISYSNDLLTLQSESGSTMSISKFIGSWYNCRNLYDMDTRGLPLDRAGSTVYFPTDFSDKLQGYIVEHQLSFSGRFSGKETILKIGDGNVD